MESTRNADSDTMVVNISRQVHLEIQCMQRLESIYCKYLAVHFKMTHYLPDCHCISCTFEQIQKYKKLVNNFLCLTIFKQASKTMTHAIYIVSKNALSKQHFGQGFSDLVSFSPLCVFKFDFSPLCIFHGVVQFKSSSVLSQ